MLASAAGDINAGNGCIRLSLHGHSAIFSELSYRYPLKLLSPRINEPAVAIAYVLTYGGGLISGDRINVKVEVSSGTTLLLLTQVRIVFQCIYSICSIHAMIGSPGLHENLQG